MRKLITWASLTLASVLALAATPIVTLHDAIGARVDTVDYTSVAACEAAAKTRAPGPYECRPSNRVIVEAPISEWIDCAPEGGTCSFSGTRQVRYGANGKYSIKTFTASTACSNAVFGDPIAGVAKRCGYSGKSSGGGPEKPTEYTKTQMFALANPSITVMAGQDMTMRVRFYGVRLPDQSKVFGHLYRDGDDYTIVANLMHHYQWVPTQSWTGYVEYDYLINIPVSTPPGSYRLGAGLGQGVDPYAGRQDYVVCNGIERLNLAWSPTVQPCLAGRVNVTAATLPASTATDGPMSMFYATGRTWAP